MMKETKSWKKDNDTVSPQAVAIAMSPLYETKVEALLNHTQSTSRSRGQASHPQGRESVGNGPLNPR